MPVLVLSIIIDNEIDIRSSLDVDLLFDAIVNVAKLHASGQRNWRKLLENGLHNAAKVEPLVPLGLCCTRTVFPGSRNVPNVPDVPNVPHVPNNVPNENRDFGFFSNSPNGYAHQNCTAILCKGVPSV